MQHVTYDLFVDHGGELGSNLDTILLLGNRVTCQLQLREGGKGRGGWEGQRRVGGAEEGGRGRGGWEGQRRVGGAEKVGGAEEGGRGRKEKRNKVHVCRERSGGRGGKRTTIKNCAF